MAVTSYESENKRLWMVYINLRSRTDPTIRTQRRIMGIETEKAAKACEKKLIRELTEEVKSREALGLRWQEVLLRWEEAMKNPDYVWRKNYHPNTIHDYLSLLRRWTRDWLSRPAAAINQGDARLAFNQMKAEGKSHSHMKSLKNAMNVIYTWGIEEQLIKGVNRSPAEGMKLVKDQEDKIPEILTKEQVKTLLYEAKRIGHPWYSTWAMALLSGMRNGELYALKWEKVDVENGIMRVDLSYDTKTRSFKCPKAKYWRNVPISPQLHELLLELKTETGKSQFVLPRHANWDRGGQAGILRDFCKRIAIPSVRFHTLRACFATHLLADGVPAHRVMSICGWRETKTMDIYSRLAGVDVRGATDSLKILPDVTVAEEAKVINLGDLRRR